MICRGNAMRFLYCFGAHSFQASLLLDTSPLVRQVLRQRPIDCADVAILLLSLMIPKAFARDPHLYRILVFLHRGPLDESPQTEEVLPRKMEEMMIAC